MPNEGAQKPKATHKGVLPRSSKVVGPLQLGGSELLVASVAMGQLCLSYLGRTIGRANCACPSTLDLGGRGSRSLGHGLCHPFMASMKLTVLPPSLSAGLTSVCRYV